MRELRPKLNAIHLPLTQARGRRRMVAGHAPHRSLAELKTLLERLRQAVIISDPLASLGERPVVYRVDALGAQLLASRELSFTAPLGDGTARSSWAISLDAISLVPPASRSSSHSSASPWLLIRSSRSGDHHEFFDLLAARSTAVLGIPSPSLSTVGRFIEDCVVGAWSEPARVHLVGFETGLSSDLASARFCQQFTRPADLLDAVVAGAPAWDLESQATLCVLGPSLSASEIERVAQALRPHRGVAILSLQTSNSTRAIMSVEESGAVTTYLNALKRHPVGSSPAIPGGATKPTPAARSERGQVVGADHCSIDIAVLGAVTITGTPEEVGRRPIITELVTYLAMHPQGALSRSWAMALWPERRVPAQTIANRLSEARRILGIAPDGRPRLRRSGDRHHIVDITTDWQRFVELADSRQSPSKWAEALQLVRGRPFDDLQQGQWTTFEGIAPEIEQAVVDCALRLGADSLSNGDYDVAHFAASAALKANPFDERLYRLLMHCADGVGNRAGVEETLRMLALVLEIDGDPLKGVHPTTASLYRSLVGH